MEGFLLVELVAVSRPHDVRVHVLLSHEEFAVADHRVLEEPGAIVETVLLISRQRIMVKLDTTMRRTIAPVTLVLSLGALNRGAEISCPFGLFIVGCSVH